MALAEMGDDTKPNASGTMMRLRNKLRSKWKVCFVAAQIVYSMPDVVPGLDYPKAFRLVTHAVAFVNPNIGGLLPMACLVQGSKRVRNSQL